MGQIDKVLLLPFFLDPPPDFLKLTRPRLRDHIIWNVFLRPIILFQQFLFVRFFWWLVLSLSIHTYSLLYKDIVLLHTQKGAW